MKAINPSSISSLHAWQQHRSEIEAALTKAFRQHALSNRGFLAATGQAPKIAQHLYELAVHFLEDKLNETALSEAACKLADDGLAITSGAALMQAMTQAQHQWLAPDNGADGAGSLANFQVQFMAHLAQGREQIQQETQEKAQQALQQALHTQLQQQSDLSQAQGRRNQNLRQIMELNARLTLITDESALLDAAVSGICQTLDLEDVTFYEVHEPDQHWSIRTTTAAHLEPGHNIPAQVQTLLDQLQDEDWTIHRHETPDGRIITTYALVLQAGQHLFGAMIANSVVQTSSLYTPDAFALLLQTFAQNLATLWRNAVLLAETTQRARELEILHGRYVDSTWSSEKRLRQAEYRDNRLQIIQEPEETADTDTIRYPLQMADFPFGQVQLPAAASLDQNTYEFVEAIVHEMASALSNAQLLQTTRLYSNQLSVAAEVSRAATTYLDRDRLIAEVVELIRARFGLYYVGLFLTDEEQKRAVLQAGTGEAGRVQVEQDHNLPLDNHSMVGQAITSNQFQVANDVTMAFNFKMNPLLPETQSEAAFPLRARGHIIGALTVQSTQLGAFTDESITVLQSLTDQLAISIANAGLFAQTEATLQETSNLYEASRKLSEAPDQDSTYQVLVEFTQKTKLCDVIHIVRQANTEEVTDDDAADFIVTAKLWTGANIDFKPPEQYHADQLAPYNRPLETTRKIIIFADSKNEPSLNDGLRHLLKTYDVATTALLPILTEGQWLGTIILHRLGQTRPFTEDELQALRTLADQSAIILANQRLFAEIQTANEKLRQLDQLKTQFLANMSHELRTPLNSIIGFSRVILKGIDGPITPEQEEDLTSIHNNGQHLLTLINEILDMAKIEAGKMMLSFEEVDLAETSYSAITAVRNIVEEKGLTLRADIADDLPVIEADPVRLKQILINLLSNAAKYTDSGQIDLLVKADGAEHIQIAVQDTGIGIAPEDYETLFRPFEQIDNSSTRIAGGTGLGLPLTKWMVTMHHGEIWFDSQLGHGTTFCVRLPIFQPASALEHNVMTFMNSTE
jgi:signal transduction histidine kinase/putative methionine-R-sulfoxide reductase with GAF domain